VIDRLAEVVQQASPLAEVHVHTELGSHHACEI
jgi:hypothetical protein